MGIEIGVIATLVSTAVGVVSGIEQSSAQKKAAKADQRARQIANNRERAQQIEETRRAVRERRVKAAQAIAASEGTGTGGSSAEFGFLGSLDTQTGANVSRAEQTNKANEAISGQNQISANARSRSNSTGAFNKLFQNTSSGIFDLFD